MTQLKVVALVCFKDGFANSVKPEKIKEFLEKQNCTVHVIDTLAIHRLTYRNGKVIVLWRPTLRLENFLLYFVHLTQSVMISLFPKKTLFWKYPLQQWEMILRKSLLTHLLISINPELTIVESQIDSLVLLSNLPGKTLFDCPTPLADEQYFGGEITKKQYKKLIAQEKEVFKAAQYLSFHWHSYGTYIRGSSYNYTENNLIELDFGCDEHITQAKYNITPKIIYLGYLGGSYINFELLAQLTRLYPHIDVYGTPKPDSKYKLNYRGYSAPEAMAQYQFGLITFSKDTLRKNGFSAKHLEYLSYGLPVFVPDWRQEASQIEGSILYNEQNFLDKLKEYSQKSEWEKISKKAKDQSKKYLWNTQLLPLIKIINSV